VLERCSLDVLRLLARRVDSVPVLIVASYRDDELDHRHPLRVVLGELATSGAMSRVRLAPLSHEAVATLAEPYHVNVDELYRKTGGNPFFVVEALAAGAAEIPDTVRDAVLARAARLGPDAHTLLEAVAVVPRQAELWLLDALAGDAVARLDECLASGMLSGDAAGVGFRHELARLAIDGSITPDRKLDLHRRAVAALNDPPAGERDLARLAHHAEGAGDVRAVLRYARAAAARAALLGAHREAVAQYARALRSGDSLSKAERAELLALSSRSCYLTDQYDQGIAALEEALSCWRALGDKLHEGDAQRRLSEFLWCPGRTAESDHAAREAVTLLKSLPPGRELALAYENLATNCASADLAAESGDWAQKSLELAERLGDREIATRALATLGLSRGVELVVRSLEQAEQAGFTTEIGRALLLLAAIATGSHRHEDADRYLARGIDFCSDRGLELYRLYLFAYRARSLLDQGCWEEAADSAGVVLRIRRTSTSPRIAALVSLGLVRVRRGDPGWRQLLDEAWALAEPTGELIRLGPVAEARAEAAWLQGDGDGAAAAVAAALPLAIERGNGRLAGALAVWRQRAGAAGDDVPAGIPPQYEAELAGEPVRAAELWAELGCPYEAGLALASADDDAPLRRGLEELQRLGASPAASIAARRLRKRGARGLPRGPRPATRRNPAGLTPRQAEVLALVAEGFRNGEIADRLTLSSRTVDHHVAAILRKLGVRTRGEASVQAVRLGLAPGVETARTR
jgi:DNA-binding CsgD family transcriptional regulator/tetratricopeptide (TPR) repeat protein